jgi:hypothetical protein
MSPVTIASFGGSAILGSVHPKALDPIRVYRR